MPIVTALRFENSECFLFMICAVHIVTEIDMLTNVILLQINFCFITL